MEKRFVDSATIESGVNVTAELSSKMSRLIGLTGVEQISKGVDPHIVNTVAITAALTVLAEQIAYGSTPGFEDNMTDEAVKQLDKLVSYFANQRDNLKGDLGAAFSGEENVQQEQVQVTDSEPDDEAA